MNPTLSSEQIKTLGSLDKAQVASYNRFRATGFSPEKSLALVLAPTPTRGQQTKATDAAVEDNIFVGQKSLLSSLFDAGGDVISGFRKVGEDASQFGVRDAILQAPLRIGGGISRGIGRAIGGALETADDLTGEIVSDAALPPLKAALSTDTAQDVIAYLDKFNKENRGLPSDILEILTTVAGSKVLSAPLKGAFQEGKAVVRAAGESLSDFLKPTIKNAVEDSALPIIEGTLVEQAPKTATRIVREAAEATAPSLTLGERAIGITTDVKGRLQEAGEDLTKQYIDVAKTRNVADTVVDAAGNKVPAPTPYGFAAQRANKAAEELQRLASETGGVIGKTRERLASYTASIDDMSKIEGKLLSEAEKMNLTIKNGKVVRARGIQTASEGDIKAIQNIYDNLKVVKESQKLPDLIEFRSAVDQNIKFGKRASEVSDAIDPLSRALRTEVAETAAKIVGKTEAAELAKFSDFMDALHDLRSFTDRQAGGEYLLRLVSSGRGDEARRLVNTIREYTGIDLMNDATLMTLTTDLIGNAAQKNLFRQEITKAGGDVQAILSGSPTTIGARAIERGIDFLTDAEKILINAAKK